jgi:hypothetical protein
MKTSSLFRFAALGAFLASAVQSVSAEPPVIAALRADKARIAAMVAGDGDALARLMSDQLRFVHSDGRVESKADYVKNLTAGDTAYKDAKTSELETMQVSADVVVVLGVQEMKKRLGPDWSDIKLRYLAVWRNEYGAWRMIAWQSARPTGNSVVPKKSRGGARRGAASDRLDRTGRRNPKRQRSNAKETPNLIIMTRKIEDSADGEYFGISVRSLG